MILNSSFAIYITDGQISCCFFQADTDTVFVEIVKVLNTSQN